MGKLFEEILVHSVGAVVPPDVQIMLLLGLLVALSLWCVHYAVESFRTQPVTAIVLMVIAAGIALPLVAVPTWTSRELRWLIVGGFVEYLPLGAWTELTLFRGNRRRSGMRVKPPPTR